MTALGSGEIINGMLSTYLVSATLRAMLCTSAFVYEQNTHNFRSDVTDEVLGTGYAAGGVDLTGLMTMRDVATNVVNLLADEVNFGTLTVPDISSMVIYRALDGDPEDDIIVGVYTFPTESRTSANFTFTFAEEPINTFNRGIVLAIPY